LGSCVEGEKTTFIPQLCVKKALHHRDAIGTVKRL
jgi:hypothetical protein